MDALGITLAVIAGLVFLVALGFTVFVGVFVIKMISKTHKEIEEKRKRFF